MSLTPEQYNNALLAIRVLFMGLPSEQRYQFAGDIAALAAEAPDPCEHQWGCWSNFHIDKTGSWHIEIPVGVWNASCRLCGVKASELPEGATVT